MTDTAQTAKKYHVLVKRAGKMCIPKDYSERWGYDAFLPEAGKDYKNKPEDVRFISIEALTIDDHLLLQEAHLNQFSDYHNRGCLADNLPFGIICIPKDDPLRAIIPADKKMHSKLQETIYWIMQKWYNTTPENIEIIEK
ncbi:MAG: hypothetical protein Q7J54_03945 [Candidatus Woesearchaeota archaeon]|nr:hypothetical protein [Candidatus Woesearchaeota archaeon]